jgi:hypothetical protein
MKEQIASDHLASKGSEFTAVITGIFSIVTGVLSSMNISEWAAVVGIMVALSGLVYRHRESNLVSSKSAAEKEAAEAERELFVAQKMLVLAEIDAINKRAAAVEKAGHVQVPYHTAPAALDAINNADGEPAA